MVAIVASSVIMIVVTVKAKHFNPSGRALLQWRKSGSLESSRCWLEVNICCLSNGSRIVMETKNARLRTLPRDFLSFLRDEVLLGSSHSGDRSVTFFFCPAVSPLRLLFRELFRLEGLAGADIIEQAVQGTLPRYYEFTWLVQHCNRLVSEL
eukprot:GHVU01196287.1.p2 GENE.GHVU01196287.1~~GHVU01196287.1.p2  ORF type:complete len:152 (-),score=0.03 GHVU01196287.1:149-604(-)